MRTSLLALAALTLVSAANGAQASTETTLYSFTDTSGAQPMAGVTRDKAGNLYGTATYGGSGYGTVFKLAPDGTETTLHSFTGGSDGKSPYGAVILDQKGNVYGTASYGGAEGYGDVYKIAANGRFSVLYSFTGGNDGSSPESPLFRDKAGDLFGTAKNRGGSGYGTVFKLAPDGTETTLYSFTGRSDGAYPIAGLVQDKAGNVYGTASYGGAEGYGDVYKIAANGTFSVLYSFTGGSDGANPSSNVIVDKSGNLYGTTPDGGSASEGVVFEIATNGTESILHTFTGRSDGGFPGGGLVMGKKHTLYGTTLVGGVAAGCTAGAGCGTIFSLGLKKGTEKVLYAFTGESSDGANPGPLTLDKQTDIFYGSAQYGGAKNFGTVFEFKR